MRSIVKIITLFFLFVFSALSSAQTLSPEQINRFLALPEAQQKALAEQYGIDIDSLKSSQSLPRQTLEPAPDSPVRPLSADKQTETLFPQSEANSIPRRKPIEDEAWAGWEEAKYQDNQSGRGDSRNFEDIALRPVRELEPFGYELFAGEPTTFAPVTEIPIPAEYIIGPGDTVRVQMFGKENQLLELIVTRDGQIQFPQIGPMPVAGLSFNELKGQLTQLIKQKFIGVESAISLGELRSIRVFILGEARTPGAYTVSSLSTITNALFVSGGVKNGGSLRNIQLKRQGKLIATMDLYDLLLRGDTSSDQRLLPGDVIFIPPKGKAAGIGGYVNRPAIYELKDERTLEGLVQLAGGLRSEAYPKYTKVERVAEGFKKSVLDVNLLTAQGKRFEVKNGDLVTVGAVDELVEGYIKVSGEVSRPGVYDWKPGLKISDVVHSIKFGLLPDSDLDYALIVREVNAHKDLEVIHVKLGAALSRPGGKQDVALRDKDRLLVFNKYRSRSEMLEGLLAKLQVQATPVSKQRTFEVLGTARLQGEFPLPENYTIRDALDAAGGIDPSITDLNYALLVREVNQRGDIQAMALNLVDIFSDKSGSASAMVQPLDKIILFNRDAIREPLLNDVIRKLRKQASTGHPPQVVTIGGSVRFPGEYPVTDKLTLDQLITAAGGLLDSAYTLRAEVSRLVMSSNQSDLEIFNLPIRGFEVNPNNRLQALDKVFIKTIPEYAERYTVTLDGEVQFPGEYVVKKGETLSQVVHRAGGFTSNAFAKGALFTRERLAELEAERLKDAEARLQRDLATLQLEMVKENKEKEKVAPSDISKLQDLLSRVKSSKPLGRLVVDVDALMKGDMRQDVILQQGDKLMVPPVTQSVTVIGEVQFSTSHIYHQNLTVDDYIKRSGGETSQADSDRTYVVKANGSVWLPSSSAWFANNKSKLSAGDTIVVPLQTDRLNKLQLWTNVSQIFYQIALGAAAVGSL
ncbi:SLBB domain-containing protein [Hahella sp. KA22]|uniref:polysaccharide biosynthesis/export family protein n=1 Tax=Hahella sp. KA22 TaxID=1628392 RepID=UPI0013E3DB5E|nr:SLBB domain-containing protein [Hahella sp. KA22]